MASFIYYDSVYMNIVILKTLLFAQSRDLGLLETLFGKSGQTSCTSRSWLFQFIYFTILQTNIYFCIVC